MPDFQYQPPTGPLSGSEFERQTTRFFQQVQGAADAAQSTAIVAQTTANEALERAQASNFVDGKTTQAAADGAITVKDVAIGGDLGDLASARGQIGAARELGNNVDYNTVTEAGFYLINATGGVNGPIVGSAAFLQVFYSKKDAETPPHAWGRRRWGRAQLPRHGNTPTCVGKTMNRPCGLAVLPETPPHAWGRHEICSFTPP